jgi:TRAP transporter TAXI family solute receptor
MSSFRSTAQILTDALSQLPDVSVQRMTLGGSRAVLDGLQRDAIDIGVATADVSYLAFAGQLDRKVPKFDRLRGLAVMGLEWFHLMVKKNSPVKTVGDLRGLKVGLSNDAGTQMILELLIRASGLAPGDVHTELLQNEDVSSRLVRGELDAAFMNLNIIPPPDHTIIATRAGARLLEIQGTSVERLRLQHPFLVRTLIPRATYPGQEAPIHTIGVDILLVCRADLDDDLVYRFMKAYFAVLARASPATDLDRAPAMAIPLHPAAVRYYRERELSQ